MSCEDYVWEHLGVRRHAFGRRRIDRMTRRASSCVVGCGGQLDVGAISASVVEAEKKEVGMGIILGLLLSAIVNEIVHLVARWWMDRHPQPKGTT